MSCFEEGAEPLVVDFHEHEPPGCQKKTLEIIVIIIIIQGNKYEREMFGVIIIIIIIIIIFSKPHIRYHTCTTTHAHNNAFCSAR